MITWCVDKYCMPTSGHGVLGLRLKCHPVPYVVHFFFPQPHWSLVKVGHWIGCHFRHNPCTQMIVTVNMFLKLLGQTLYIPGLLCTYVNVAGGRKNCDNMPFTWNWMIGFGFIPRRTRLFLHKGWHLACFFCLHCTIKWLVWRYFCAPGINFY